MIKRLIEEQIAKSLTHGNKIITLLGPRRVGKTTLLKKIAGSIRGSKEILNGDYLDDQSRLKPDRVSVKNLAAHLDYLFIDEAQNIDQIGITLKIIHDEFPSVRVMATGSSSFDLTHTTGEPLTGRQDCFVLYPISFAEQHPKPTTTGIITNHALLYGSYPETLSYQSPQKKVAYLKQLASDYLLKDIYRQVDVHLVKLQDILRLLAFQIGSEVSLNEIGRNVHLDVKTVARYLSFLERAFVIVRLRAFSRNLRKEISKSQKIYFFDLGIRNAIISGFNPIHLRDDVGKLWENFCVIERMKRNAYKNIQANYYFWRTYDGQEIDFIEEKDRKLFACEFKFGESKKKMPLLWSETYSDSETAVVTPNHIDDFLV